MVSQVCLTGLRSDHLFDEENKEIYALWSFTRNIRSNLGEMAWIIVLVNEISNGMLKSHKREHMDAKDTTRKLDLLVMAIFFLLALVLCSTSILILHFVTCCLHLDGGGGCSCNLKRGCDPDMAANFFLEPKLNF
ncbi:hypothetical protein NPIL_458851 [Nephila pilipes]|uniref:Uncharacterized protein n=1 Tax=Nephila pilipes TaxID=299642 RepID=A0A8X6TNT5_NEPPI|nr:hypothetical protein NPIL_458851 [Nephila pilipes]